MANKNIKKISDLYQVPYASAVELFNKTQAALIPSPPFDLISNNIIQMGTIPDIDELVDHLLRNYTRFRYNLKKDYSLVNSYLYPPVSTKKLNKIFNSSGSLTTYQEIAEAATKQLLGHILVEFKEIYLAVKDLTYPELTLKDFDQLTSDEDRRGDPEILAIKITSTSRSYILNKRKGFLDRVKNLIYPKVTDKEIIPIIKEYPREENPRVIAKVYLRVKPWFILKEHQDIYEMLSDLVYPKPSVERFSHLIKDYPIVKTPQKYAQDLCAKSTRYVMVDFGQTVQSLLYPKVSFDFVQKESQRNPQLQTPQDLASHLIKTRYEIISAADAPFYKNVQQQLQPKISVIKFKTIRAKNPDVLDPEKLAELYIKAFPDHLLQRCKNDFVQVSNLLMPKLTVQTYNKYTIQENSTSQAAELARTIAQQEHYYVLKSEMKSVQSNLYPEPPFEYVYNFMIKESIPGSAAEVTENILKKQPNKYIPARLKNLCQAVQNLISPPPSLPVIYKLAEANQLSDPEEITEVFIQKTPDRYMRKSDCDICSKIQKKLHPEPDLKLILKIIHEQQLSDPQEAAAYFLETFPNQYIPKGKKEYCSDAQAYLAPKPDLSYIYQKSKQHQSMKPQEFARIIAGESREFFMIEDVAFEEKIQEMLYPKPDLELVITERNKYPYLIHPDAVAKKIAKKYPKYTLSRHRLGSIGWYDD